MLGPGQHGQSSPGKQLGEGGLAEEEGSGTPYGTGLPIWKE